MKKFNEEARSQSLHGEEPQTSRRPQWGIAGRAACWTKTSAYRLLHEDKALVFGTTDFRLEFCQNDSVGKE